MPELAAELKTETLENASALEDPKATLDDASDTESEDTIPELEDAGMNII